MQITKNHILNLLLCKRLDVFVKKSSRKI